MRYLFPFFLIFSFYSSYAQKAYQFSEISIQQNGEILPMPFAGGINAAQVQSMDTNGDGKEELVIWDINSRSIKVFQNTNGQYKELPYMPYFFPKDISGFMVLADYDGDGKKDLFTSTAFGIKAYKNITTDGKTNPEWEVAETYLKLENGSNFQANNLDIPAIQDLDGDGDLDIVIFNYAAGDYLEYYKNTSIERTGNSDIDAFAAPEIRWGNFEFCGCGSFAFGQTCDGDPISRKIPGDENSAIEHSGGHSILLKDFNGDGIVDMMMGQDECNTLYYLENEGSNTDPIFNSFSTNLPGKGNFPQFPIFHIPQILDDQLLVSTNSSETTLTAGIDFSQSLYLLDQNLSPISKAFLQEDMLDLGENTRPFFRGNASSGALILTANTIKNGEATGQAFLYDLSNETLKLIETDYLGLSQLGLNDLQYLEYTNTEQDNHLFISGTEIKDFLLVRKLYYSNSQNVQNLQEISIPNTTLRPNDHFEFYQHQGEDYMLLAKQTGELQRYKVTFENSPQFELLDSNYLGFADSPASRNLIVKVSNNNGQLDLYAIDQSGVLAFIPGFNQLNSALNTQLLKIPDGSIQETRFSRNTWISTIPQTFGNKVDLLLGNRAGGLRLLKDISTNTNPPEEGQLLLKIYPNPTIGPVELIASQAGEARLISSMGQILMESFNLKANTLQTIDLSSFPSGLYLLDFISNKGKRMTKKLIVR
ncbi:T9SS type A sorting domain-containing protein [Echinicola marina]|uniref:FG-GAP-like repeat-containing protein n=1 Tax=Echinicola marina TaxID=2859768 RepID=UPI001CF65975|nr:FG-GAP-like repeat-containing protein [Echinicola marina]UCS95246.1 T9SS type A sorting domain-containing protein [Echinicola marina]